MGAEDRLRWRCRRGTRELDLMLGRYLERSWPRAGAAERAAFERLLDIPDPELHALLTGAVPVEAPDLAGLIKRMHTDIDTPAIVRKVELDTPDGRPLHGYQCTGETFMELESVLKQSLAADGSLYSMAREFVFWAVEHIRSRFRGGKLTWDFVFSGLGMHGDHAIGKMLVVRGLQQWGRKVVELEKRKMYLYSLMREGGVPESLLQEKSLYRKAVMGLVAEIERERIICDGAENKMASRWVKNLPQTFRSEDFERLLADLAKLLVRWRAELPESMPGGVAQRWLDTRYPGWKIDLPLRMTPQVVETLIRPALETHRSDVPPMLGPVLSREMKRQNDADTWLGYLKFNAAAWLPGLMFPNGQKLKLRLSPTGHPHVYVNYHAIPEAGGWQLYRFGRARDSFQFPLHEEFALTAYADNRLVGEAIVDSGLPLPGEAPSFWEPIDKYEGVDASRLIPLHAGPRTRASEIWLLAARDMDPVGDNDLTVSESESAPDGRLWRISGCGTLRVGNKSYFVRTNTEEEGRMSRMFLTGNVLQGWRRDGSVPVYRESPRIFGLDDSDLARELHDRQLRRTPGRLLWSEIAEWVEKDETLARVQYISLPPDVYFQPLRESGSGKVIFSAEGLENGLIVTLQAANESDNQIRNSVENGHVSLELDTLGAAPGLVNLRLFNPEVGKALDLQAIWPAKRPILLDPQGHRLRQNESVSIDALNGWRAVVPDGVLGGDLQLELVGHRCMSLPVQGEVSLAANSSLIRAMLAQGELDAQVNVSLYVRGIGSERLEIRRYHDKATVRGDILQVNLDRDRVEMSSHALSNRLRAGPLELHAVDINAPNRVEHQEDIVSFDLRALLGEVGGPWLIQSRFNNRVQRPTVWGAGSASSHSQEDLIRSYAEEWRKMLATPQHQKWDIRWNLFESARQGGDVGVLYQVQALAQVPAAAVALAMRVPHSSVSEVMDLDTAIPIFWPALPVAEFVLALTAERCRQVARLSELGEEFTEEEREEIDAFSSERIIKRIRHILVLRPELIIHFGMALREIDIFHRAIQSPEHQETLSLCLRSKDRAYERLEELSQQVARRVESLPAGICRLGPADLPFKFSPHIQPLIDAPFIAAEMAAVQRPAPDVGQKLALINLRHVDPAYFDEALPVALHFLTVGDS